MTFDLAGEIGAQAIRVSVSAPDWEAAIRAAGEALVADGATTDAYTEQMVDAVHKHGPYIVVAPGVALAHARPSEAVMRDAISLVTLADPVVFGHGTNDPVTLVLGLAARDHDSHLEALQTLATVLADPDRVTALTDSADEPAVRALLTAFST